VLVTNLVNYAQPLIRYELSVVVTLADGPNPAGRPTSGSPRSMAAAWTPSISRAAVVARSPCTPPGLGPAFAALPEVRQYQIPHDHRGLHVRVVLAGGPSAGTPARLRLALVEAIEAVGAVTPPIEVEQVAALEREPGPAAKVPGVPSAGQGVIRRG